MELIDEAIAEGEKRLRLAGRLDIDGTEAIATRFTALSAATDELVIVDMAKVEFVASIGIRLLLSCAKAKAARGGKMALVNLQPMVRQTLEVTGIQQLIPCFDDEQGALAGLKR